MKTFAWVAVLLALPLSAVADPIQSRSDLPSYSHVARDLLTPWIAQNPSPTQEPLATEETPVLAPQIKTRQPAPPSTPVYSIPEAQIQQKGAQSLADTLKGLPGFAINDVGPGADIHTGTYYRGQTINQSAVLLNGRPFGSNINTYHGGTDFNSIPVEAIDKVELSSGSSTTLYGSEAIGGVINVVTKKGRGPAKLNAAVEYGSLGQSNYRTSYGGSTDRMQYNLSYQSFGINNRYPVPVGAANRDPETGLFFNADTYISSYLGSFTFELDERNTLSLDATKFLSRRGLIYFGFPLQRDRLDHDGLNFGLSWKTLLGNAEDSTLTTTVGYNQDYFSTYGPSSMFSRTGALNTELFTTRIEHQWATSANNTLRSGLDIKDNHLVGNTLSTNPSVSAANEREDRGVFNAALFALDSWSITDNVQLELGLRENINSRFGSYLNPSAGVRWAITPAVALRGSWASVQRNPDLDQLYIYDTVHGWTPNANLVPETGSSYTGGLDVQFSPDFRGQFTYFGTGLNNRLAVVSSQWQNIGAVATNGFETALRWQIAPQWSSFVNYTYTDATIQTGPEAGLQLALIPYSVAQAGIGYENEGLQVNLLTTHNSGPRRAFFNTRDTTSTDFSSPFTTMDLRARVPLTPSLALTAFVENLADVAYEKVNRIYLPGLIFRVGLQSSF